MSVLDDGCGTGLLGFALRPLAAHVAFADTSREMLAVVCEVRKDTEAGPRTLPLFLAVARRT